jgi:hypothetical protein
MEEDVGSLGEQAHHAIIISRDLALLIQQRDCSLLTDSNIQALALGVVH